MWRNKIMENYLNFEAKRINYVSRCYYLTVIERTNVHSQKRRMRSSAYCSLRNPPPVLRRCCCNILLPQFSAIFACRGSTRAAFVNRANFVFSISVMSVVIIDMFCKLWNFLCQIRAWWMKVRAYRGALRRHGVKAMCVVYYCSVFKCCSWPVVCETYYFLCLRLDASFPFGFHKPASGPLLICVSEIHYKYEHND